MWRICGLATENLLDLLRLTPATVSNAPLNDPLLDYPPELRSYVWAGGRRNVTLM